MKSDFQLEQIYNLIGIIDTKNEKEKEKLFNQNFDQFIQFYDNIFLQIRLYQYKDLDDENQCEKADKFFHIIKWILQNDKLFLKNENYRHIPDAILEEYRKKEEFHAVNLMFEGSINKINSERDHFAKRDEIEKLLKNKKDMSYAQKVYLNNRLKYYKYYFGHAIPYLDDHFTEVPENEIIKIIKELEDFNILNDIINSQDKTLSFEDGNLAFQYITFVLKVKSVFKPKEVYNDTIIQKFWEGKIKNRQIIHYLFSQENNEDLKEHRKIKSGQTIDYERVLKHLLKQEGWNGKNFYAELLNHFAKVEMSQENIHEILKNIIPIIGTYEAAELLGEFEKYPQIKSDFYLMSLLRDREKRIILGSTIEIPFNYALKNVIYMSKEMEQNLITLIYSNYYTEEEKSVLMNELKKRGIIHDYIGNEELIEFKEQDTLEETILKVKIAYENRKVVPIEIAKKILKLHYKNELSLDEKLLKSCVVSIISNILKQRGIDIKSSIYFGNDKDTNGINYTIGDFKGIWINNKLIEKYIESGDLQLFITIFHEMRHALQNRNIKDGNIDYLTYNFIKEQILCKNDPDFYNFNYYKMFIEEDARQYGIIDAINFFREIDILLCEDLKKYCKKLNFELNNSNINQDSNKENPFRTKEKMNISDYLGRMIKNNPAILNENNEILKLEYNLDGTTKDIATMLKEYRNLDDMDEEQHKNFYSIYYGLITSRLNIDSVLPEEIESDLTEFMKEQTELISSEDMRYYAINVNQTITRELINSLMRGNSPQKDTGEGYEPN